jgi:hypothetical protein
LTPAAPNHRATVHADRQARSLCASSIDASHFWRRAILARAAVSSSVIWIVSILVLVPACASIPQAEKSAPSAPAAPGDAAHRAAAARDRITLARMQMEIAHKKADEARVRKEHELELAKAEITQFDEVDAPNRVAKARLDLARHKDMLFEQKEELAQLEMMYEKEDLADKTREIVLQRGKRRAERAQEELAIAERETQALETRTIPRERSKLVFEAETKARDLEGMARETEATILEKRMAVEAAEAEAQAAEAKVGTKP